VTASPPLPPIHVEKLPSRWERDWGEGIFFHRQVGGVASPTGRSTGVRIGSLAELCPLSPSALASGTQLAGTTRPGVEQSTKVSTGTSISLYYYNPIGLKGHTIPLRVQLH